MECFWCEFGKYLLKNVATYFENGSLLTCFFKERFDFSKTFHAWRRARDLQNEKDSDKE